MGQLSPPNHGGQQRRLTRLVRPYVLENDEYDWLPGDQAADARGTRALPPGGPARAPYAAMAGEPAGAREPSGRHRHGGHARRNRGGTAVALGWLQALSRHSRSVAIGSIAGIVAFAVCALLVLPHYAPRAAGAGTTSPLAAIPLAVTPLAVTPLAATQDATGRAARGRSATSSASLPAPATPASPAPAPAAGAPSATGTSASGPSAGPSRTPSGATPAPPRSSAHPTPTPSASPTTRPVSVSLSYTLVQQWQGGFQGQVTIVNNGGTAINGWQLSLVLPRDHITATWDATFQTDGDILILNPPSYQTTIQPGASLQESFVARGHTPYPVGCSFNGAAC